jgi:hypothetical protein
MPDYEVVSRAAQAARVMVAQRSSRASAIVAAVAR